MITAKAPGAVQHYFALLIALFEFATYSNIRALFLLSYITCVLAQCQHVPTLHWAADADVLPSLEPRCLRGYCQGTPYNTHTAAAPRAQLSGGYSQL